MDYSSIISPILGISSRQIAATIALLDEKATIPFIARYRKERTGNLDEVQIASIADEYRRLQELSDRKETILRTIEEQGKLTPELRSRIESCWNTTELEDIYLPYRPHRKTRADVAREQGLEPLAKQIFSQQLSRLNQLNLCGHSQEEALQGARDIIAEWISQDERARNAIRREFTYSAVLTTKPVSWTAKNKDFPSQEAFDQAAANYRDYFKVTDPLRRLSSHRLLAIRRAESEGFIRVDISCDEEKALDKLGNLFLRSRSDVSYQVELAMEDSYKRLLKPSIETEFAASSKEKADTEAIRVFADNLRQLLLESPLGQKRVLALDPGFRTGCKCVILSPQGDLLYHTVIYLHNLESCNALRDLIAKYQIEAIAIGNGTASRECEQMVHTILKNSNNEVINRSSAAITSEAINIYIVNESGASIYSASKIGREEFPNEDVTVRGAVSIGRRLMDPLAELVKIDPKSIGVGQYQHDVDQTRLRDSLNQTVESVVNYVGVDVNTASRHLLTYISGLGPTLAQNIVDYRAANGAFQTRQDLKKVPKLGPKAFEQCAGFLRIAGGKNPLDNTAVHPESYSIIEALVKRMGCTVKDLIASPELQQQADALLSADSGNSSPFSGGRGVLQLLPSRDPRSEAEVFHFSDSVHTIDDLQEGMRLPGIVTNISAFGAFVDLGIHKDGLIHISEMANRRISDPSEVVKLHQHVEVRVLSIDRQRGRIALSLKNL